MKALYSIDMKSRRINHFAVPGFWLTESSALAYTAQIVEDKSPVSYSALPEKLGLIICLW